MSTLTFALVAAWSRHFGASASRLLHSAQPVRRCSGMLTCRYGAVAANLSIVPHRDRAWFRAA